MSMAKQLQEKRAFLLNDIRTWEEWVIQGRKDLSEIDRVLEFLRSNKEEK